MKFEYKMLLMEARYGSLLLAMPWVFYRNTQKRSAKGATQARHLLVFSRPWVHSPALETKTKYKFPSS